MCLDHGEKLIGTTAEIKDDLKEFAHDVTLSPGAKQRAICDRVVAR